MSVGLTTLKQAETVLRSGDPDLIAKVDAGDLPVYKAVERLKARERRDREPVRREDQEQPEPVSVEQWLNEHVQDGDAPAERDLLDQGDTATFRDPTLQRSISVRSLQEPEHPIETERAPVPAAVSVPLAHEVWSFEAWKNLTLSCRTREGMAEMKSSWEAILRELRLRIARAEWQNGGAGADTLSEPCSTWPRPTHSDVARRRPARRAQHHPTAAPGQQRQRRAQREP